MSKIIEIKNLNKSFGEIKAVNDLSFSVEEGELFAFLGVNGAGKSTTISVMCGRLKRDGGSVIIDGKNPDIDGETVKRELGVVFQNCVLDKQLTVYDNLLSRAALYGISDCDFKKRLAELTELLGLENLLNRTVGKLSGGQRRRIDIARALIHRPKILVLDEPTTGLDPQTRMTVWGVIHKLRKEEKTTVFLTTHYMEETLDADNVVIIDGGRKVAEGSPLQLKNAYTGDFINLYGVEESDLSALDVKYEKVSDFYRIAVENTAEATKLIIKHPQLFNDYEVLKGKMDDVFLAVTGKKLSEAQK